MYVEEASVRKPQSSKIEADPHSVESDDFQEFESYHPNEEGHKTVTSGSVDNPVENLFALQNFSSSIY